MKEQNPSQIRDQQEKFRLRVIGIIGITISIPIAYIFPVENTRFGFWLALLTYYTVACLIMMSFANISHRRV